MNLKETNYKWVNEPKEFQLGPENIEIITEPHTDLWQRTYYKFRNENAPMLLFSTDKEYFSFTVKTEFDSKTRFDQCGLIVFIDQENWIKCSVEYGDKLKQKLGCVVTNNGYSDWSFFEIDSKIKTMYYRLSRREDDFCLEYSLDGEEFNQMRISHLFNAPNNIDFGIYACSPEESSFKAKFSQLSFVDCAWEAHDGQQPDEDLKS